MSSPEPTRDQLLAMAYADGELEPAERGAFEQRLEHEPRLARDVAEYQALQVLSRQLAPREPMDYEWKRLATVPTQRGLHILGWSLFVTGVLGVACFSCYGIATSAEPLWVRLVVLSIVAGLLLLLLATTRGRIRTYPLDPYREVQR